MRLATTIEEPLGSIAGYDFGEIQVDLNARCLWVSGTLKPIERKTFELLVYLIAHRHRVVTRGELHGAFWEGRTIGQGAIAQCVWTARKALGGGGFRQTLIRTVNGVGYQFVGRVTERFAVAGQPWR